MERMMRIENNRIVKSFENYSIYYMRLLAIILIVNSHFRAINIENFEPVLLYDKLGYLGNMIFFFISSYVLTLGFKKYEKQKVRWVIYRLSYLAFIIVSLRVIFGIINADVPDIISMLELRDINFISVMFIFSLIFPVLWLIDEKHTIYLISILYLYCLVRSYTVNDRFFIGISEYLIIFLLGILFAKTEIKIKRKIISIIAIILSISTFLFTKVFYYDYFLYSISRFSLICFLFFLIHGINNKIPSVINKFVKFLALLSLYIYLTHGELGLINFSYQLNKYLAIIILFMIVTPICYLEQRLLSPVVARFKKVIFQNP